MRNVRVQRTVASSSEFFHQSPQGSACVRKKLGENQKKKTTPTILQTKSVCTSLDGLSMMGRSTRSRDGLRQEHGYGVHVGNTWCHACSYPIELLVSHQFLKRKNNCGRRSTLGTKFGSRCQMIWGKPYLWCLQHRKDDALL